MNVDTTNTAAKTFYIREVVLRYRGKQKKLVAISEASGAAAFIRKVLPDNVKEHMIALYLNSSHAVVGYSILATGSANSCALCARDIYQAAVCLGAVAMILSHNHPSGSIAPSEEDRRFTNEIEKGGKLLGIKLLDHIIVTDDSYYSLNES